MVDVKKIKKSITRQHDQMDCGPACLSTIINYFGGEVDLSKIKEISGATIEGTTLLGLYQAAESLRMEVDGYETDIDHLQNLNSPVILHITLENKLEHYIVCFGFSNGFFHIADPANGYEQYTKENLVQKWSSGKLLLLKPKKSFIKSDVIKQERKKWLLNLVKDNSTILVVALVLGILITTLNLATAIFTQKLVDVILPSKNIEKLAIGLISWGLLLITSVLINYLRDHLLARQSYSLNISIIQGFFKKLLYQPKLFFDGKKTGDMVARMNDTEQIENTIREIISSTAISALMFIIAMVFVFLYYVPIGVLLAILLPLYFIIVYSYDKSLLSLQKKVMYKHALNESVYIDTINFIEDIKTSNKENIFSDKVVSVFKNFQLSILAFEKKVINFSSSISVFGVFILVSVVAYGAFSVLLQELMIGELLAILSITLLLMQATTSLAMVNIKYQGAQIAFDRMFEFTRYHPKENIKNLKEIDFKKLKIHSMSFRFIGKGLLLNKIDLELKKGEIIALFGESGSGKSTLLQILQRFYSIESGEIKVNNQDLNEISNSSWRTVLGVVPQEVKLLNGNLIENICLEEDSDENELNVVDFCKKFGFDDYFKTFSEGYLTVLGEDGVKISGGQRQLVAIARALYQNPQVLLLDEPTSAMDRNTKDFVFNLLKELKSNIAILIVTHSIKDAFLANRIYILEDGKITYSDSPSNLLSSKNFFSESYKDLLEIG